MRVGEAINIPGKRGFVQIASEFSTKLALQNPPLTVIPLIKYNWRGFLKLKFCQAKVI